MQFPCFELKLYVTAFSRLIYILVYIIPLLYLNPKSLYVNEPEMTIISFQCCVMWIENQSFTKSYLLLKRFDNNNENNFISLHEKTLMLIRFDYMTQTTTIQNNIIGMNVKVMCSNGLSVWLSLYVATITIDLFRYQYFTAGCCYFEPVYFCLFVRPSVCLFVACCDWCICTLIYVKLNFVGKLLEFIFWVKRVEAEKIFENTKFLQ